MHPKVLETAEKELRETESRKAQTLQQFREWIEKHPFLVSTRRDDIFLLMFLRLTKYNVDKACQRYEKSFIFQEKYPNFSLKACNDYDKYVELMRRGFVYPLDGFDYNGCKIIVMRMGQMDPERDSVALMTQTVQSVFSCLLEQQETQICKYNIIFDYENVTLKHVLKPTDYKIIVEGFTSCVSVRVNKFILVNASPFVAGSIEVVSMLLSEKLKKRLVVLRSLNDMKEMIQPSEMLPTRYGGNGNENAILDKLTEAMRNNEKTYKDTFIFNFNKEKLPKKELFKDKCENIGSFLKLEID